MTDEEEQASAKEGDEETDEDEEEDTYEEEGEVQTDEEKNRSSESATRTLQ